MEVNVNEELFACQINIYVWKTIKETIIIKGKLKKVGKVEKQKEEITVQYRQINYLKKSLKTDEVLIHVDFSGNYALKYETEIQSMLFGGSRGQVTIHQGVLYYRIEDGWEMAIKSFDTPSENPDHGAFAIISNKILI